MDRCPSDHCYTFHFLDDAESMKWCRVNESHGSCFPSLARQNAAVVIIYGWLRKMTLTLDGAKSVNGHIRSD